MLRILVLAGLCWFILQPPAAAQETASKHRFYLLIGGTAGRPNNPRAEGSYEADLGIEIGLQMGIGYAYSGLRVEALIGYETFYLNELKDMGGTVISGVDASGKVAGPVGMVNFSYQPSKPGEFRPFIGAGYGVATLNTEFSGQFCSVPLASCFTNASIVSGTDTVAAWQWFVGMSKLTRDSTGEFFIGYRYFETQDFGANLTGYGTVVQDGLKSHSIMLGWRWFFGTIR